MVDSFTAHILVSCAPTARLRGAQLTVVGIQPDVALTMVELGLTVEPAPPLSTCKTAWTTPLILAVLFFLWVVRSASVGGGESGTRLQQRPPGSVAALALVDGMNLDGGGSTTMVVGGRVTNAPSDAAGERPVGDALLVLPRR